MPTVRFALMLALSALLGLGCPSGGSTTFVQSAQRLDGLSDDAATLVAEAEARWKAARVQGAGGLSGLDAAAARLEKALTVGGPEMNLETAVLLCRVYLDMVSHLSGDQAERFLSLVVDRSSEVIGAAPERAEGHYYKAVAIARQVEITADLGRLPEMLALATRSSELDAKLDDAGALRLMGKVYIAAPSWPDSVGDLDLAVEVLEEAVKLAPIPLNRLFLGQAYFYADDAMDRAAPTLKRALEEGREGGMEDRWIAEGEALLMRLGVEY